MKATRRKKSTWYRRIAVAIQEMRTIDLQADEGGWDNTHQLIALHMLRELNDRDRHYQLDHYTDKVQSNFDKAVYYLMITMKIPVYRIRPGNRKATQVVTLDAKYRNATEKNYERIRANMLKTIRPALKEIARTGPRYLPDYKKEAARLLGSG